MFALLSAFNSPPEVWSIFGDDLFQTSTASARFSELLGVRGVTLLPDGRELPGRQQLSHLKTGPEAAMLAYEDGHDALKPLDCVGSKEEALLALWLAEHKREAWVRTTCRPVDGIGCLEKPHYLKSERWKAMAADVNANVAQHAALLDDYNEEHNMPPWFAKLARKLHEERVLTAEQAEALQKARGGA